MKRKLFLITFSLFTLTSSLPAYSCSNIVYGCMSAAEDAGDIDIYGRKVMKKFCKCLCKNRKEETSKMRAACKPLLIEERFGD